MDRGKPPPKKPPIRRGLPLPDKIIPLGSKGRPDQDPKPTPSLYSDRKREASAPLPSHVIPPKTKLVGLTPLGRAAPEISRSSSSAVLHKPGIKTIEVPPIELVDRVLAADEAEDDESIDKILCGALKSLKTVRAKPSPALYLGLMYLAKVKPMFFESENVIETTCSLLKRDIGMSFKSKGNALVSVVACNLLMHAFVYEHNWPDIFVKVYLEDAHGERVWVDHPYCKEFVTNIQTAFGTKLASPHLQMATDPLRGSLSDVSGSGSPSREDAEGSQASSTPTLGSEEGDLGSESQETMPRYSLLRDEIEKDVVDFVKEQLVRRQGMDTPRNLLRLLTSTCGFSEVRLITAQRLEMWLQNPKLTRPAQELLVSTCVNCCTHSQEDVEVIGHLIKIRLKTKPLINHYLISMKELLSQHKENLPTVVKHVIYNELSNARNPNNMALLGALFQHSPELAAKNLAAVFQDLLMNRDDYLRALRALFREIVKALRYDVDFVAFCRGLMTEKTDRQFTELEKAIKDRMFASLCDLICLASLLSVTPQIREIVAAYTRGERKASDMESLRAFQAQVSMTQRDCVWWIHTIAISMFTLTQGELNKVIQKLVFLDTHEGYCSKDNWPQETDRGLLLSLLSEVPVQEDTLMRLLIMGLERTIPLAAGEALDLVDKLVKRAAVLQSEDFQVLKIERTTLIDVVLNSCVYHHPENITLPQGILHGTIGADLVRALCLTAVSKFNYQIEIVATQEDEFENPVDGAVGGDLCGSVICLNGGQCDMTNDAPICTCPSGYEGVDCVTAGDDDAVTGEDKIFLTDITARKVYVAVLGIYTFTALNEDDDPIEAWDIAFDETKQKLYWTNKTDNKIYRGNWDMTERIPVSHGNYSDPTSISIDESRGQIYCAYLGDQVITRIDLDDPDSEIDLFGQLTRPSAVELDETNG
eukprot:XP_011678998.1 PREDICTED: integrator complex subunit 1 [Strongylocentrotus purpuratus]